MAALAFAGAAFVFSPALCASQVSASRNKSDISVATARIVARFPHDPSAFTQGLIWHDGTFYESTGRAGQSEVRRTTLNGQIIARARLPEDQFGEGLAHWDGELVSLTWKNGIAYRWDARSLARTATMRYQGEGWGLAGAGNALILSDGSSTLQYLDPETFAVRQRVTVTLNGVPLNQLNELEMVGDELFANIWHSSFIARIDPRSGQVKGLVDLRSLVSQVVVPEPEAVLNGIAWDAAESRLFVTGKLWPHIYQIELVEQKR